MLYMKEDDMDEMLCRAAENYEVDAARVADWDFVYAAVHEPEGPKAVAKKTKKRRFSFWWLLLIPLGWLAITQFSKFQTAYNKTKNNSPASVETKTNAAKQPSSSESALPGNNSTKKNTAIYGSNNSADAQQSTLKPQQNALKQYNDQKLINSNVSKNEYSMLQKQEPVTVEARVQSLSQTKNSNNNADLTKPNIGSVTDQPKNDLPVLNNEAPNTQNKNIQQPASSNKKEKEGTHYFYAGLLAGADLSFVKFQKKQPLGYNIGLLVGYKFNKFSIESGLLLAKKNYYTDGEYFNKSKIPFFDSSVELLSVQGYCRMYEIPLNIRYDISSRKKHTWFATAGLSSYLMSKEYYHYAYQQNGEDHYGSYPYYKTTQDWFSVLNVSAGYQVKTGAKTSFRVEPYYKATLSGVGTGSLSISSAGINVGITRRIP